MYFAKQVCGLPIRTYVRDVVFRSFSVFALSLFIGASPLLFLEQGVLRLIVTLLVSVCAVMTLVWLIGLTEEERVFVRSILSKVIGRFKSVQ